MKTVDCGMKLLRYAKVYISRFLYKQKNVHVSLLKIVDYEQYLKYSATFKYHKTVI